MDNYICINGKKARLTSEQLEALGICRTNRWVTEVLYPSIGELRVKYTCPNYGKFFYTRTEMSGSMLNAHRYCGYCGTENVSESHD